MNKNVCKAIVVISVFCLASALIADNNSLASYIRVGIGAKAMAMGGTGTAFMDNITATYWNPAGLARIKTMEFGCMYTDGLEWDKTHNFAAFGMRLKNGYAALSWINANVTDFHGYDEHNVYTGDFNNNESNFALSYAYDSVKFKLGLTAKLFMSTIDDDLKTGVGSDIGMIFDLNQHMSLGFMIRDLYSKIDEDEVPSQYSFGVAIYPIQSVVLATDIIREKHSKEAKICLGAEYWAALGEDTEVSSNLSGIGLEENTKWEDIMAEIEGGVRVGLNDGSLTCGVGLKFKMFEANYAYITANEDYWNDSHKFSIIFKF